MDEHHAQNRAKKDSCFAQMGSLDIVPKSKVYKIYKNVSAAWNELDREYVNCRRNRCISNKYKELEAKYYECVNVFEQWVVLAALIY